MNTDNLITPEGLPQSLKMAAEGIQKKPGLMKSTGGIGRNVGLVSKIEQRLDGLKVTLRGTDDRRALGAPCCSTGPGKRPSKDDRPEKRDS